MDTIYLVDVYDEVIVDVFIGLVVVSRYVFATLSDDR